MKSSDQSLVANDKIMANMKKKSIRSTARERAKKSAAVKAAKPSKKAKKTDGKAASGKLKASISASVAAGTTKNCLDLPAAVQLVRSCAGVGDDLPLSTTLGQIFPSSIGRTNFCQCVANGVPIDRSEIPCGANNTLQDVVNAIAC